MRGNNSTATSPTKSGDGIAGILAYPRQPLDSRLEVRLEVSSPLPSKVNPPAPPALSFRQAHAVCRAGDWQLCWGMRRTTYAVGADPSVVMMGLSASFFLFLLADALFSVVVVDVVGVVAEAGLEPLPLAPAIRGTSVVGGMAPALMASMLAVGADLDAVVMVAGAGAEPEFVVSLVLFILAVSLR
ncbi:hypothetical protein NPX13_g6125 [Xylaria arbuscula]|uniref:Uncharacterized protein n=1 Tax=Xylaria arbuscula TaxID=114810 RepID=A0A9W8TKE5_9PEZI|nr:hypothetical protein NPX13_g6125 [Xylaria arbuscula]